MADRTRKRGDTYPDRFVFKDTSGNPVDLTGWTNFQLTIDTRKAPEDDTTQVLQITVATPTTPLAGVVEFPWLDADANRTGDFYYDVQAIMANGKRRTWPETGAYKYKMTQDINKD